jgi:glycosyltransferase involved in cell wall biosynthesis
MILLISSVFPPEPVVSATVNYDLADSLSDIWEVKVITPKPTRPLGFSYENKAPGNRKFEQIIVDSFTCPASRIFGRMKESYSFGKHAAKYIKEKQKEIESIYIHSWPLLGNYIIAKKAVKYSIPYIIHIVDIYPEALLRRLPFLRNTVYRLLLPFDKFAQKNSFKVVTISEGMKELLQKTRKLGETQIEVVNNWQNEDMFLEFNNSSHVSPGTLPFTFMYLGSLSNSASIHTLISAFHKCEIANSRLIIAGDGAEKKNLIALASDLRVKNIEFWDAPLHKVPELQSKADVLLLSLKKGAAKIALPSKLPAYMFSGKPIIACVDNHSDTANAIRKAGCGWIVVPEDVDELSATMKTVRSISNEELLNYGSRGYNYALEHFSKRKNLDRMVSIISKMLEKE